MDDFDFDIDIPQITLEEIVEILASKQEVQNFETNGDRLAACLPEMPEQDRLSLMDYLVTAISMVSEDIVENSAHVYLAAMSGIELGRELERRVR